MNDAELELLLADVESDRVERTQSLNDTNKFCEAICAFANDLSNNQAPGYLFVGALTDGRASGATITDQLLQNLAALRADGNIQPLPVLTVQKRLLGGGEMAVVEVMPADLPPVRYKGRVCIRVGPRRAYASEADERVLTERRGARVKTWDSRVCAEAMIDDLALDLFAVNYRRSAVDPSVIAENGRDLKLQLASLRFFDLRSDRPTNAAILLFGKDPCAAVPGAFTQYVKYDGPSEGDSVLSERRFSGDLLNVMRQLAHFADEISGARPVPAEDGSGQLERIVFDYHPKALHELLMNAVIHRNYDGSTTPIMLSHFIDRIEILNPGALFGDLTVADFPRMTAYRNPVLAEAAKILGFVNRFGRGIDLAQTLLSQNGSSPATFQIEGNHFLATIQGRQ